MWFLALTILQSTAIFVVLKLFSRYRIDNWQAITTNYVVATLFGFIIYRGDISPAGIAAHDWLWYSLVLGLTFIGTFFIFALSAQKVGVALTSVASKMSVIIPVLAGLVLLKETINLMAGLGVVLALLAFYLTLGHGRTRSFPKKYLFLPLLLFLGNGINDTLMKYAEFHYVEDTNDLILFLSVVFLTALILGLVISAIRFSINRKPLMLRNILAGVILGMINFGSTFYILKAMGIFESSVVFPVTNAGIVSLSVLTGYFFFRERLKLINWVGIAMAIIAIILIANA